MVLAFLLAMTTGAAPLVVVSQVGASAPEVRAARELADALSEITGREVPLRTGASSAPARSIVVGPGPAARAAFPDTKLKLLGPEELVMRTRGGRLLLAGGRPRGTMYAVYRWLQTRAGVRWWTPWASRIPRNPNFTIAPVSLREKPAFESRDPFWFSAFDGDWAARNYSNSQSARLDASRGGKLVYGGFVHTYYTLVPPDKYFKAHPEWYSLIDGKRTADRAQLCTTNQELRDFIVEQVRAICRANPDVRIVSVSQNDWYGACQCPNCKALDDAQGTPAGSVLALANYVGEKIEKEFPNVAIDTLAYQYTRRAPRTLRPRKNVIVRLCSIEANFAQPLDHPSSASFARDLRDWSRLTNRLYVWDYVTDFANYIQPFPNYLVLGPNLRFFAKNGVKGVFEEGAYQSTGAEMSEMRAWVLAQLLWNPFQDEKRLISEFLAGYYGPAAPAIQAYLDLMAGAAADVNTTIFLGPDAPFLSYPVMRRAEAIWNRAEAAVAGDPQLRWRVRIARLAPRTVWLRRWDEFRAAAAQANDPWPLAATRAEAARAWLADATAPGPPGWTPITHMNEGGLTPAEFVRQVGG